MSPVLHLLGVQSPVDCVICERACAEGLLVPCKSFLICVFVFTLCCISNELKVTSTLLALSANVRLCKVMIVFDANINVYICECVYCAIS